MPRDASAVAVPGFCCCSGPEASDMLKEIGTKMPFQVPSSGNDSAEMVKLQNPLVSLVGQLLFLVLPQASALLEMVLGLMGAPTLLVSLRVPRSPSFALVPLRMRLQVRSSETLVCLMVLCLLSPRSLLMLCWRLLLA